MDKPDLGISILNDALKAAAAGRDGGMETWESPASAANLNALGPLLGAAAQRYPAGGKSIALVLAHPQLTDQVVEIPHVRGWKLARLLERLAQSAKAFSDEAAWSSQPALPTKQHEAVLLHLCPKPIVDQLARACTDAQRQLVRILPATSVLSSQLKLLPLQKDELALLAAETGTGTTVVVGRKDGRVCLGRVLRKNWIADPDSVGVDLTRSIGFAEQQSGLRVASVWLFGSSANDQSARLGTLLNLPVQVSPVPFSPFYWAEQAIRLPDTLDGNLMSIEARQAASRRRFVTATGWLLCLLGVIALATMIFCQKQRDHEIKSIAALTAKIDDLRVKQKDLEKSFGAQAGRKDLARVVNDEKLIPVCNWFLADVQEAAPDTLALSQCKIARATNLWTIHLAGAGDPASFPGTLRQAVNDFSNTLATGPFHVKVTHAALDRIPGASHARRGFRAGDAEKEANTFAIDGVMR
jgi:hypothetical protein